MEEEARRLAELAGRVGMELLQQDFGTFLRRCFRTLHPATAYLPNWHIALIGAYLEACRKREIRRLVINMPPRALKSMTVSVAWPAFLLGHNPAERIMTASYASGLSVKHAVDCRHIVQSAWYRRAFPALRLAKDQNEKHKFATTAHGHRIATSVGGTVTGEGGDFLIVDDPHNAVQAMSATQRRNAIDWFDQSFATRLDDKRRGVIVVVMQRLHEDDLSGHLLAKGGWEHLCLPAIATETQSYSCNGFSYLRPEGEALHMAREGKEQLQEVKRELGSHAFSAQYQQQPMPMDAGMVKRHWFGRYAVAPENFERVVQSWDTAIKAGESHDQSVCVTIGEKEGIAHVLDVTVLKAEYPELKRAVERMAHIWQPDALLMEDKASGQSLLQDLRGSGFPLIAVMPAADKVTRFAAVSALIEAGKVALPREAAWLADFERELLLFPQGKHDDQVDAFSQYLGWLRGKRKTEHGIRRI